MSRYPPIVYYQRTLQQNGLSTFILYSTDTLLWLLNEDWFYFFFFFFSSSEGHQSKNLLGWQATGINSSPKSFLSSLQFSKCNMPNQKFDKNNSLIIILHKTIIKTNIIKIYIQNIHSSTVKYSITRVFIKVYLNYSHLHTKQ